MRFTLIYTGELKANGRADHKHQLRKAFHAQLKILWQQDPLASHRNWFENPRPNDANLNRRVGPFRFVPLVSPDLFLVCELHICLLRPEPPGALITQGGDIDNRLKTLFDALRLPQNESELPKNMVIDPAENPFFCLLEDDNLITGVSVKTDRLLLSPISDSQVHIDIAVETHVTRMLTRKSDSKGYQISGGFALS